MKLYSDQPYRKSLSVKAGQALQISAELYDANGALVLGSRGVRIEMISHDPPAFVLDEAATVPDEASNQVTYTIQEESTLLSESSFPAVAHGVRFFVMEEDGTETVYPGVSYVPVVIHGPSQQRDLGFLQALIARAFGYQTNAGQSEEDAAAHAQAAETAKDEAEDAQGAAEEAKTAAEQSAGNAASSAASAAEDEAAARAHRDSILPTVATFQALWTTALMQIPLVVDPANYFPNQASIVDPSDTGVKQWGAYLTTDGAIQFLLWTPGAPGAWSEEGQRTTIFADQQVATVAALGALPKPTAGRTILVLNAQFANDKGMAMATWKEGSTEVHDGIRFQQCDAAPGDGMWHIDTGMNGEISAGRFGCQEGGVDQHNVWTSWLQFCEDTKLKGRWPAGSYQIDYNVMTQFYFEQGTEIQGAGMYNTTIVFNNTHVDRLTTQRSLPCFEIRGQRFFMRDFAFDGLESDWDKVTGIPFKFGMDLSGAGTRGVFERIRLTNFYCGLWFLRGWGIRMQDIHTWANLDGVVWGTLDPDGPGDPLVNINASKIIGGNITGNYRDGFRFDARDAEAPCQENEIAPYAEGNHKDLNFAVAHDVSIQGKHHRIAYRQSYTEASVDTEKMTVAIGTEADSSIVGLLIDNVQHNAMLAIDNTEIVDFRNATLGSMFGNLSLGRNVKGVYGIPVEGMETMRTSGGNINTSHGGYQFNNTQSTGHPQYVLDFTEAQVDAEFGAGAFSYIHPSSDLTMLRMIAYGVSSFQVKEEAINTLGTRWGLQRYRRYARLIGDGASTTGMRFEFQLTGDVGGLIGQDLNIALHWRGNRPRAFAGCVAYIYYYVEGDPALKSLPISRLRSEGSKHDNLAGGWVQSNYIVPIQDLLDNVAGTIERIDGIYFRAYLVRSGDTALVSDTFDISHVVVGSGAHPANPWADAQSQLALWKLYASRLTAGDVHIKGRPTFDLGVPIKLVDDQLETPQSGDQGFSTLRYVETETGEIDAWIKNRAGVKRIINDVFNESP